MPASRLYFDYAATAPLRPVAHRVMEQAMQVTGNASSIHDEGRQARRLIEQARQQMAALVSVRSSEVILVSGGTEAAALALSPVLAPALIVSGIEHDCVLSGGRFGQKAVCGVTPEGQIDLDALNALLEVHPRAMVAVMLANNETGILQPVADVADRVHRAGGLLLVDAVQAAGKIPLDMQALGADMLMLSSHKMGGPQGIGALIVREGRDPEPLWRGGGQQRGLRSGTFSHALAAGASAAAAEAMDILEASSRHMIQLQHHLEQGLKRLSPAIRIIGEGQPRLPNISLVMLDGLVAETAVIAFDLAGIALSAGSACSSGKVKSSNVLRAMGYPAAQAGSAIRLSWGADTTPEQIDEVLQRWPEVMKSVYKERS